MTPRLFVAAVLAVVVVPGATAARAQTAPFETADLHRLQSVGNVQISSDGRRIAYSVLKREQPGRPYSEVWVMDVATGAPSKLGRQGGFAFGARWSPDGREIAYFGVADGRSGLVVSRADGSNATFLAPVSGTNHPLPSAGERLAWAPDGNRIAFVSATDGPEDEANGDPMVITR